MENETSKLNLPVGTIIRIDQPQRMGLWGCRPGHLAKIVAVGSLDYTFEFIDSPKRYRGQWVCTPHWLQDDENATATVIL